MPPNQSNKDLPLRWESTGDRWWFASPIDLAAANGHYDLVRELLRLDANHLISLTSLRRLRRLESVWDDDAAAAAAKSRCSVARCLLHEFESKGPDGGRGRNSLVGGDYGGWLLYTAASAGDVGFVKEVLGRNPLLVFGEGEYGLTDMMYAAARSRSADVFWVLYDYAVSPRFDRGEHEVAEIKDMKTKTKKKREEVVTTYGYKWEVMNRAVHAAARGGNLEVLIELLDGGGDVYGYRDGNGCTVLHAAASKGQVEVAKHLVSCYGNLITSTDNDGNTALHVAAFKGQLPVLEALLSVSSLSTITIQNKEGNTLLHMAVSGALSPGYRRVDRQIELVKHFVLTRANKSYDDSEIINVKNNDGQTALHMAIIGNVHVDLTEHLMTARFANVNLRDNNGWTPLDYLRQHPRSDSSEILIRRLISAGGISNCQDYSTRRAIASHIKDQGRICSSPGTAFRVLDCEIFAHSGFVTGLMSGATTPPGHRRGITLSHLPSPYEAVSGCGSNNGDTEEHNQSYGNNITSSGKVDEKKSSGGHIQSAAKRWKTLFQWRNVIKKKKSFENNDNATVTQSHKWGSVGGVSSLNDALIPLRERFSTSTSLSSSNKRTLAVRSNISSPTNRKRFATGAVVNGVPQELPQIKVPPRSSSSSHNSMEKGKGISVSIGGEEDGTGPSCSKRSCNNEEEDSEIDTPSLMQKHGGMSKRYLCFGGVGLSVKNPIGRHHRNASHGSKQSVSVAA